VSNTFGPSALATPANALTLGRLVATPVLVTLIVAYGPSSWLLVGLWVLLAGSDGVDGWLARKHGATRSGAFLDPLADKVLVLGALFALASIGTVAWLPVALIAVREVAMSAFRSYAGRRGVSIPARHTAKLKTAAQDLAVLLAFIPPIGTHHEAVVTWTLWVAVALTLYTGLEYLHDGRKLLAGSPSPDAPGTSAAHAPHAPSA
jgi:CDP-diacylglycerol--glycerol-3-phosphate 3-phosphatidyltransferase